MATQLFTSWLSVIGRESPFHTRRAVEMVLGGVRVSRQDEGAGLSLDQRALLVPQDVAHQAARRLLDVCVFLGRGLEPADEAVLPAEGVQFGLLGGQLVRLIGQEHRWNRPPVVQGHL